jgi:hypothetical protein
VAHYAVINSQNIVESVFVGVDETVFQGGVGGSTEAWENYYQSRSWHDGKTIRRCSYSGSFRKNYPGPGFVWDSSRNAFIPPKPFPSWSLDESTCRWVAPVPMPELGNWQWDELTQTWVEITP